MTFNIYINSYARRMPNFFTNDIALKKIKTDFLKVIILDDYL